MSMNRNMGIDLLRIISMEMVVFLHVLNRGGILASALPLSTNYKIAWGFETAAYCAVNCYGLISGYVGYCAKFRVSNLVLLWFRVVWYTLLISAIFEINTSGLVGIHGLFDAIFPASTEQYWYFTAYVGLFFFIPMLNMFINKASQKQLTGTIIACICLFSIFPTVFRRDIFYLNEGYSAFWLGILYLIGGYLAKYKVGTKCGDFCLVGGYCVSVFVSWFVKMIMDKKSIVVSGELPEKDLLITYLSPTILFAAIFLVLAFSRLELHDWQKKCISFFAPLSFSVYLIHFNPLVKEYILQDRFADYALSSTPKFVLKLLIVVSVIFFGCLFIDIIREQYFKRIKLREKVINVEKKICDRIENS